MRPQTVGCPEQKCLWILESREAWRLLPRGEAARSMQGVESGFCELADWVTHQAESFTPLPILGARTGQ
jgi:hypothetical protein